MAITKLHRYKEETLKDGGYKRAVKYICNPYKTDGGTLIGGNCGCDPERAFETMIFNKAAHGKADGTAGFHYKISFPPDEAVTPEAAMRVTEEFCQELLGGEWPVIYSVHTDKAHLHSHIIFDSVAFSDGRKFHSPKGDWERRIQPITDGICRRHGLTTLDYEPKDKKGLTYEEWLDGRRPEPAISRYDVIRADLDEAAAEAADFEDFKHRLVEMGYSVRGKKLLSVRLGEMGRAVRTHQLGEGYSVEELKARIAGNGRDAAAAEARASPRERRTWYVPDAPKRPRGRGEAAVSDALKALDLLMRKSIGSYAAGGRKLSAAQRGFYRQWRFFFFYRPRGGRLPPKASRREYREALLDAEEYSRMFRYLLAHDIRDADEVRRRKGEIDERIKAEKEEAAALKRAAADESKKAAERAAAKGRLKAVRKEIKKDEREAAALERLHEAAVRTKKETLGRDGEKKHQA